LTLASAPRPIDTVATHAIAAGKWRMTFDQPVVVDEIPLGFRVNGAAPTGMVAVGANVLDLSFAVPVSAGQAFVITAGAQAVRSRKGGCVAPAAGNF
jgi:hypothetical protein